MRRPALLCLLLASPGWVATAWAAQAFDIGLSGSGARVEAVEVAARSRSAPTIVLVGGLQGDTASADAVRAALTAFERGPHRVRLLAVPMINPDGATLQFPPTGVAYREHPESHVLWRWLGSQAPDLVLIAGEADQGLAAALGTNIVADMGRIPARRWSGSLDELLKAGALPKSEARNERERRLQRSPRQVAQLLAGRYGHNFDQPLYIPAIAMIARTRLGELEDVKRLAEPWVNGTRDSLARPSALVMAGHIVFTELARRTGDPRYTALVRRVADLGFDSSGNPLEAMPFNGEYSDSVFMGTVILAQAGALTGEQRYFEMADRHLRFMERLDLRPDGLYRHQPASDAAWGRGNGFAALGLALTLSELPRGSAAFEHALASYRSLMAALLPFQTRDGLWRNVVDHPGAYAEFTATAMIGFALQRGLREGWIDGRNERRPAANAADAAWAAINARVSDAGGFIDVCESTARMTSLEQYLKRAALLGPDDRGGAMALLFATERMGL